MNIEGLNCLKVNSLTFEVVNGFNKGDLNGLNMEGWFKHGGRKGSNIEKLNGLNIKELNGLNIEEFKKC